MRLLDLFSGIGGFSLAAQWVWGDELEIEAFVEIDPFCQKVLEKHWPGVPIYGDIKKIQWVVAESPIKNDRGYNRESEAGQIQESGNGSEQRITIPPIDLITAGFPCQPFSCAGRRTGTGDDRYLWPETIRTIRESGPTWIVLENVAGLLSILEQSSLSEVEVKEIELFQQDKSIEVNKIVEKIHRRIISRVIDDLKQAGYLLPTLADGTPIILCLPACGVGAPHRRDRIWIVGYASGSRRQQVSKSPHEDEGQNERRSQIQSDQPSGADCHAPDSNQFNGDNAGHGPGEVSQLEKAKVQKCTSANTNRIGFQDRIWEHRGGAEKAGTPARRSVERCGGDLTNSSSAGLPKPQESRFGEPILHAERGDWQEHWYEVATRLCRVDDGVSRRVDRLRSLGNSVVPQVAAEIFRAIKEVEGHGED